MNYRLLGKSGLRVSELCLGTMTFGTEWGFGTDKKDSKKVFDAFVNAGGNFLDCANLYNEGTSEKYTGEFISHQRDYYVLATKYTLKNPGSPGNINASGNNRKSMMNSVEDSLKISTAPSPRSNHKSIWFPSWLNPTRKRSEPFQPLLPPSRLPSVPSLPPHSRLPSASR